jgi:hypothetical protein
MNYEEWVKYGVDNNWCGPAVCYTHDGLPTSLEEDEEFDESDPCIHIIRLYEDVVKKQEVEDNHSPSNWRKNGY